MKKICVFSGSSPGLKHEYINAARDLGAILSGKEITLVYGGAKVGLMGEMAKACISAGGEVIGIIPKNLADMGVAFTDLDNMLIVDSMHERKMKMTEMADAFIALPGGLGTIEEFFEVLTWAQLGLHRKPCGLLNTLGYYDKMIEFLQHTAAQGFIETQQLDMIQIDEDPRELLRKFEVYRAPQNSKAEWALKMTEDKIRE